DEFLYLPEELSPAPPPVEQILIPPSPSPNDPPPPNHFLYPKAGTFKLRKTSAFQRGYIYTTPYNRENSIATDHYRMLHVATPPQLTPRHVLDPATQQLQYCHDPVPDCIQMVPGVPYAFEIDGNPNELHTIGAVHTFESLRHEHDFWPIYDDTVLVAKGLRGCRQAGDLSPVFPITDYSIKTNDRSPPSAPGQSKAGSYNLASTLLKGNGPGVVLPAAQADSPEFAAQTSTVLQAVSRLRRAILRKTLSKAEYDLIEFNAEDMNVIGFGGLQPTNATAAQLNLSSLYQLLCQALGIQGSLHTDSKDEVTRRTYFLLLLSLPPGSCFALRCFETSSFVQIPMLVHSF
ncbi:hypothetical protein R3P38DRAFT_2512611, partial [Favolaschia claudopus]